REEKTTIFVTHDVEEALLLADRLIVFSARPARVVRDVDVTAALGRARSVETRDAAPFLALRRQILADLREPMEAARG
ncbi:MAG: ABC transporter ATP-binding protein, partial [Pseudomonadota bacterium]